MERGLFAILILMEQKQRIESLYGCLLSLALSFAASSLYANPMYLSSGGNIPSSNALDLGQETQKIMSLVANKNASVFAIHQKAENDYEFGMPGAAILIRPHLHPYKIEPTLGEPPATIEDLISAARDRIENNGNQNSNSTVEATLSKIDEMESHKRISYAQLPSNELGVYNKLCGGQKMGKRAGTINLHNHLAVISVAVGRPLAACVLFHEAGHASDRNICHESTEDVESYAFHREYDCIEAIYPTGEELLTTYQQLNNAAQAAGASPVIRESMNFIKNIYDIYRTGGDDQKIRELVNKLYNSDGTPSSPGA